MQLIHTQAGENGGQKRFERGNGFGRCGRITPVGFKGFHHVPPPSSLCPAWLHLLVLFPGLLSTLCTLIAPLPYPHVDARPLCRGCQIAHKPLTNEVSQPPGEVGRNGFVISTQHLWKRAPWDHLIRGKLM